MQNSLSSFTCDIYAVYGGTCRSLRLLGNDVVGAGALALYRGMERLAGTPAPCGHLPPQDTRPDFPCCLYLEICCIEQRRQFDRKPVSITPYMSVPKAPFTQDSLADLHANLCANALMLLATCVNTPIYSSVSHNLHACVARCSASCMNWAFRVPKDCKRQSAHCYEHLFPCYTIRQFDR